MESFLKSRWLHNVWLQILVMAILYYLFGRLSFLVAISPGNVTPVWPPAGIALLFIILWGKKLWPGIVLGAFSINLHFYLDQKSSIAQSDAILISLIIALGTTAQTFVGAYLYRLWGPRDGSIRSPKDLFVFAFVITPLTTLVSSVCGTLTLYLYGCIPFNHLLSNWIIWYIGDYSGIVIFCTLGIMGKIQFPSNRKVNSSLSLPTILSLVFILGLVLSFSWKVATQVEKRKKVVIGISRWGDNLEYAKNISGFKAALASHGYIEGENIEYLIESPYAKKNVVKGIVEKFLDKKVDLLFIQTTPATLEAKKMTSTIPIVFSIVTYPVETGVIASLESSGNNLVGTRNYIPMERQYQVFKRVFKTPKHIGFVHRKDEPNSTYQLRELQFIAKRDGIEVIELPVENVSQISSLLKQNLRKIDSVFSACDTLIQTGGEDKIIDFVRKYDLPDFACLTSGVKKGSLIGNVSDFVSIGVKSGELAVSILHGKKPSDLKTLAPENDTILLNLKRVEELRLTIDKNLLDQVSEVVR